MPLMWNNQAALDARYVLRGEGSVQQDNIILRPNSDGAAFLIKNAAAGTTLLTYNTTGKSLTFTSNPGGTFESKRVDATSILTAGGLQISHDSATFSGSQEAGLGVTVNRTTPAVVFNNSHATGSSLQCYQGATPRFEVGTVVTLHGETPLSMGDSILATNAATGYTCIRSMTGTPTAGTITPETGVPMVYDSTAHKVWFHFGGTWRGVAVT